jgi:hypothetical protein
VCACATLSSPCIRIQICFGFFRCALCFIMSFLIFDGEMEEGVFVYQEVSCD